MKFERLAKSEVEFDEHSGLLGHVQAAKAYGEVEFKLHLLLTLVLDVGETSAARPGRCTFGKEPSGPH